VRFVEGVADVEHVDAFVAAVGEVADETGATVQVFDARYVAGEEHLRRAVELADRAIDRGENVARDRAVEILLYAAGRRQIDDALTMGVSAGEVPAVALVDGGDEARAAARLREMVAEERTLGRFDGERLRAFFDVTDAELAAVDGDVGSLVRERVALLNVEK
jgi:KEOPS complex subunit Cgi121